MVVVGFIAKARHWGVVGSLVWSAFASGVQRPCGGMRARGGRLAPHSTVATKAVQHAARPSSFPLAQRCWCSIPSSVEAVSRALWVRVLYLTAASLCNPWWNNRMSALGVQTAHSASPHNSLVRIDSKLAGWWVLGWRRWGLLLLV